MKGLIDCLELDWVVFIFLFSKNNQRSFTTHPLPSSEEKKNSKAGFYFFLIVESRLGFGKTQSQKLLRFTRVSNTALANGICAMHVPPRQAVHTLVRSARWRQRGWSRAAEPCRGGFRWDPASCWVLYRFESLYLEAQPAAVLTQRSPLPATWENHVQVGEKQCVLKNSMQSKPEHQLKLVIQISSPASLCFFKYLAPELLSETSI